MMGKNLPVFTRGTGPDAVASYDWLDLTAGVGYKSFYGCVSDLTAGDVFYLTNRALLDSRPFKQTQGNFSDAAATLKLDIDFDITFNVPSIIDGYAYLNILNELFANTGNANCYLIIEVSHVGTPTVIGTAQTATRTINGGGATREYYRENIKVDLARTKFAIGDILRLNVQWWGWTTNASITQGGFYHDPSSRVTQTCDTGETSGSDLKMDVPFKIDLT